MFENLTAPYIESDHQKLHPDWTLRRVRVSTVSQSERRDDLIRRHGIAMRRENVQPQLAQVKSNCKITTMRQRYIDSHFVKLTEEQAVCETRTAFGESDFRLNFILDAWFKVQHFTGEVEATSTDEGCFQSYAYFQCLQSPYTLLSAYELWRRASYIEASILLRHSLEVFVQLRYFQTHPERCMNHVTEQRKGRVSFKTMFDELAPGSYDAAYRTLSVIAHGNMNIGFRGDLSAATPQGAAQHSVPVLVGAHFEQNRALLIHGFYIIIFLGYLNYYAQFFPKNTIASDATLFEDLSQAQKWLVAVYEHKRNNVNDPALFDAVKPLVFI